jgi:hypothetical protein
VLSERQKMLAGEIRLDDADNRDSWQGIPTISLADDVAATRRTLAALDAPAILSGTPSWIKSRPAQPERSGEPRASMF